MTVKKDTTIKIENGVDAKLGGRYSFTDNGQKKSLYIYYVDKDEAYDTKDKETVILTPTPNWTHELGEVQWQNFHGQGVNQIVIAKDTWNEVSVADEVEVFDAADLSFTSNLTQEKVDYLEKPVPSDPKKKLENITSKVKKDSKMTDENSTLSMFKEAGLDAIKTTGADQANEVITAGIKKMLNGMGLTNEFLETEKGHQLLKTLGPVLIHYAASTQEDFIDNLIGEGSAENIQEACSLATKAALTNIASEMMQHVAPLLKDLAKMGAGSLKGVVEAPAEEKSAAPEKTLSELMKTKERTTA